MNSTGKCRICSCKDALLSSEDNSTTLNVACTVCGNYSLSLGVINSYPFLDGAPKDAYLDALLKHNVKKNTYIANAKQAIFNIAAKWLEDVIKSKLPTPKQQADNAVLFVGDKTGILGKYIDFSLYGGSDKEEMQLLFMGMCSFCGCYDTDNFDTLIKELKQQGLFNSKLVGQSLSLTMKGWDRYEELKRNNPDSTAVFMAMAFKNKKLQKFYEENITSAVSQTGFKIEKVTENPEKNENINIDILLKIRDSKFIIVDVSDDNNGAYWEAGYATGLGKKVIYICDAEKWEQKCAECKNPVWKPHFDVDRNRIIQWDANNPAQFVQNLKNIIRFKFPEAVQKD